MRLSTTLLTLCAAIEIVSARPSALTSDAWMTPCRPGQFSTTGMGPYCTACPNSGVQGRTSFGADGKACDCGVGWYWESGDKNVCTKCPDDKPYSQPGANSNNENKCYANCPKHTYRQYAESDCTACPENMYANEGQNIGVSSCHCPAGLARLGSPENPTCQLCGPGILTSGIDSPSCPDFQPATFTPGAPVTMCAVDDYACRETEDMIRELVHGPIVCQEGFYGKTPLKPCTACAGGRTSSRGSTLETDCVCPANSWGLPGDDCKSCLHRQTAPQGSTSSNACSCPPPFEMSPAGDVCGCPGGTYYDGMVCQGCPNGGISPPGSESSDACGSVEKQCLMPFELVGDTCGCPERFYFYEGEDGQGAATCQICPHGWWSPAGSKYVTDCGCPANSYLEGGECTVCPNQRSSPALSKSIKDCACPADRKISDSGDCGCPAGSYGAPDATGYQTCTVCPNRKTSLEGSTTSDACYCPAGNYIDALGGDCTACPADTYRPDDVKQQGHNSCRRCPRFTGTGGKTGSTSKEDCTFDENQCSASDNMVKDDGNNFCVCKENYFWAGDEDTGSCTACPVNMVSLKGSMDGTYCTCPPGYFIDSENNCKPCAKGTWNGSTGQRGSCTSCGAFYTTEGEGSIRAADCMFAEAECKASGRVESGGSCVCPAGSYGLKDAKGPDSCTTCPDGFKRSDKGSTTKDDCRADCAAGNYIDTYGMCKPCGKNSYNDQPNVQESCQRCPAYTTSPEGSKDKSACKIDCLAFDRVPGKEANTCICGAGKFGKSRETCQDCPDGTNSDAGALTKEECIPIVSCPAGKFKDPVKGCTECPRNFFNAKENQTSCQPCPDNGITDQAGVSDPTQCHLNPKSCKAGSYFSSNACHECEKGKYQPEAGQGGCVECPKGTTTAGTGKRDLKDCQRETTCKPGYYINGDGCLQCPRGAYSENSTSEKCESCPAGQTTDNPAAESVKRCHKCKKGSYLDVATAVCVQCGPGETTNAEGSVDKKDCLPPAPTNTCVKGSYFDGKICQQCDFGTYQNKDRQTSCIPCGGDGWTTNQKGSTDKKECLPPPAKNTCKKGGYFDGKICRQCGIGKYQDEDFQTSCKPCGPNQTTDQRQSTSRDACRLSCPPGAFSDLNKCAWCPKGQYNEKSGQTECVACPTGTTTAGKGSKSSAECNVKVTKCQPGTFKKGSDCHLCKKGTWASVEDAKSCVSCDFGTTTASTGAKSVDECKPICKAGSYTTSAGECKLCQKGSFSDTAGVTSCQPCGSDKTTLGEGSTSIKDCQPINTQCQKGEYKNGKICSKCSAGTYSIDSRGCIKCPANTFSAEGSSSCQSCPSGKTSQPGSATCTLTCSAGQYISANESCAPCQAGTFSNTGARKCTPCAAGTFSNSGAAQCSPCATGYHATSPGSRQCLPCHAGFYSNPDRKGCLPCARGSYNPFTANGCRVCPENWYQDETAKMACKPCPKNYTCPKGSDRPAACRPPVMQQVNTLPTSLENPSSSSVGKSVDKSLIGL